MKIITNTYENLSFITYISKVYNFVTNISNVLYILIHLTYLQGYYLRLISQFFHIFLIVFNLQLKN